MDIVAVLIHLFKCFFIGAVLLLAWVLCLIVKANITGRDVCIGKYRYRLQKWEACRVISVDNTDWWKDSYLESFPVGRHYFIAWMRNEYRDSSPTGPLREPYDVFCRCSVYVFIVKGIKFSYFRVEEQDFKQLTYRGPKPGSAYTL